MAPSRVDFEFLSQGFQRVPGFGPLVAFIFQDESREGWRCFAAEANQVPLDWGVFTHNGRLPGRYVGLTDPIYAQYLMICPRSDAFESTASYAAGVILERPSDVADWLYLLVRESLEQPARIGFHEIASDTDNQPWVLRVVVQSLPLASIAFCDALAAVSSDTTREPAVEYAFFRDGSMWRIRGFGEEGFFPPRVGFQRIAALIESSGRPVPMLRLIGKSNGITMTLSDALEHGLNPTQPTSQPIIDDQSLRDIRRRIQELDAGIDAAERSGDATSADVLSREREVVHDQLKRCLSKSGKSVAFRGRIENARTAVAVSLHRAYADLREGGLTAIADHLETYISPDGDAYIYSPPTAIPWVVKKSLHEM